MLIIILVKKISALLSWLLVLLFPPLVFAHEAYVLTPEQFQEGLAQNSTNPLAGLLDPEYIKLSAVITIAVIVSYILAILWATTPPAAYLDRVIKKNKLIGPLIIRLAISASFFFAAQANAILGPELSLENVAGAAVIRFLLFLISVMVFFGVFIEMAALIGLGLFIYMTAYHGFYMVTYANYFGELIVLLLFGSRTLSFDFLFFGKKLWVKSLEKYKELEVPIVRMLYGMALIFAGYTIKFQHQILTIRVYEEYHLVDFFQAKATFIAAGAGLSEIAIGLFILLGLAMRWTLIISLVFITLSVLYFKEMLWPHLMLYGISFSLLINSADPFTVDHYLVPWVKNKLKRS